MTDIKGMRALVTGASSGIGRDIARELARRGANLVITARSGDRLEELARELGPAGVEVRTIALDLALPGAPSALFEKISRLGLDIDILINNAGYGIHKYFLDTSWEEDAAMIRLLVDNLIHATKLFLPVMVKRGRGFILHTASTGAFQPTPSYATYAAAKSFVMSFSIALRHELLATGVSSSVLCPGVTYTGFQKTAGHEKTNAFMRFSGMTSVRVARMAVRSLLRGKALIVPGVMNKVNTFLTRFLPRTAAAAVAAGVMGRPENR
jgi:short-subunit dehydrogenase